MHTAMTSFPLTTDEYLAVEKETGVRHEYVNGYLYAMVGGSRRHNLLTVAITIFAEDTISQGTGCQVYASGYEAQGRV